MRRHPFVFAAFISAALLPSSVEAQEPPPATAEAEAYLAAALDTLQRVTLAGDTLPWPEIRDGARARIAGARRPADTYGAVEWALRRVNPHSFLQAGTPGAVTEVVEGRFGYVHVPQRGGAAVALADSLHDGVRRLAEAGVCGWIVDLRGNGGGNMWPMLAGIGPLLGDSIVGAFADTGDVQEWMVGPGWSGLRSLDGTVDTVSQATVAPVVLDHPVGPAAVLVDRRTGSSGEALAVAFQGRPGTRLFGEPTAGYATVNRGSALPDGANMVVTVGWYTDRRGVQSPETVTPDQIVDVPLPGWPFPTDRVATAAAAWLRTQAACR